MKRLIALILFTVASAASASFVPGPIQVNASGGTATPVGYATGGSSVPVSVLNTVPVTGTFFQASQPVTVTQPTVFGATTTYNGTQIVGIVQPTVLGATVTYNGTQVVGIVQPTVLGATVTFNGTQNVQLQTGANSIGSISNTAFTSNQGTAGTSFWGVDHSTGVLINTGAKFLGIDLSTGAIVKTGTVFLGVDMSTGVKANQGIAGTSFWGIDLSTGVTQGKAGTSAWKVDFSTGVQVLQGAAGTSAWKVDASTGLPVTRFSAWPVDVGTGTWPVSIVAGAAAGGTSSNFGATVPGAGTAAGYVGAGNNMQMGRVNSSSDVFVTQGVTAFLINTTTGLYVNGGAAEGSAATGNPIRNGAEVSSVTIPSGVADGTVQTMMSDTYGRLAVTGMPYGVIFSTYMTHISSAIYGVSSQNDSVLVSSAGANLRTYICGCTFTNTTATNGKVILASPVNATANSKSIGVAVAESHYRTFGAPANYVMSGIWPGPSCASPIFISALNASISIIQTVASSKQLIDVNCDYYQGQ